MLLANQNHQPVRPNSFTSK